MAFEYVLRDVQTEAEETAKHRARMNANLEYRRLWDIECKSRRSRHLCDHRVYS